MGRVSTLLKAKGWFVAEMPANLRILSSLINIFLIIHWTILSAFFKKKNCHHSRTM